MPTFQRLTRMAEGSLMSRRENTATAWPGKQRIRMTSVGNFGFHYLILSWLNSSVPFPEDRASLLLLVILSHLR